MMYDSLINLYAVERNGITTLGPGLRYGVWLQGCPFKCKGCITPQAQSVESGTIAEVDVLARDIADSGLEGLTISGGEPFLQVESLARLLERVHALRPEMTVIIFTGFTLENLKGNNAARVLSHVDLLIDGPYVEALNDGKGLRGSTNQQLHFLTDRLEQHRDAMLNGKRAIEVTFNSNGITVVGIPLK